MMKRLLAVGLSLTLVFSLAACGQKETETKEETTATEETAEDKEVISTDAVKVQIGFENSISEPIGQALEKWQQLVEEQGDGSVVIELFPDSQLGSKSELIDSMLLGEPVVTLADGAFYADYGVPDMGILFGPFLFDTWDQAWTLTDSDWYADQSGLLEDKGLKLIASNWKYGERHLMTNKLVETVGDLKGLKIRVPSNQIQTEGFNALGATATGMALDEVYQALQTGTIDGAENPLATLYGRKLQEVAPYLLLDGHVKNFTTWVCGTAFFDTLTEEQQELLISTGEEAGLYNNTLVDESEKEYLQKMTDEGVTVTEPSEEVLAGFKEAAQSFYEMGDKFGWSEGLYETVKEAMGTK
ncbi:C4-dicarboxylate TRAP transporter substrate-binding protein [Anaerobium acetethylicum]|uniref:Tripartite ATP-independent transporter solute receptor, DctP family n=1 Tax=Anaerobium acetethylicum TaxID=1619234 RepID=A0A1D3TPV0_9FIRM|nr:C4-dicarboxylate TRAP transporter substrate-binding protein [Anaerobium acetethylicum]SCP95544.1 tripartite ATP-independent transporter solute receptor, DctP family [Anaerobium acetethylicum]